jgi:hypothetical protein
MNNPLLVDGRNFLNPGDLLSAGLAYEGIGRPGVEAEKPAKAS